MIKVVQSIWMSKLRYGLQLCNQVRLTPDDPSNALMNAVQIAQKKMLRMLDRVSLKDHVSSDLLLAKYNLPSVNQLATQIKLIEGWKCTNIEQYPLKLEPNNPNKAVTDRTSSIKICEYEAKTAAAKMSFSRDCAKLWNVAPDSIKQASTLGRAKSEIKKFCKLLEL